MLWQRDPEKTLSEKIRDIDDQIPSYILDVSGKKKRHAGKQNNEIRNIGVVVLILGVVGYVIPIGTILGLAGIDTRINAPWNNLTIVQISNLRNSPLGYLAQGLGDSNVASACGQYTMIANLVYVLS